jgi:hypothetical protein
MFLFMGYLTRLSVSIVDYTASEGKVRNAALNSIWKDAKYYSGIFLEEPQSG